MQKGLHFEKNFAYAGCPDSTSSEMKDMFIALNEVIDIFEKQGIIQGRGKLLQSLILRQRRVYMNLEYSAKGGHLEMSPLSATIKVPTAYLLKYLSQYEDKSYTIGELLKSRDETIIYKVNASFRGDPYPGALAAIDYLKCREGKSFEERRYNLVLAWGELTMDSENETLILSSSKSTIHDFIKAVKASENKNLLGRNFSEIPNFEISRYYMQVRYGSTFSKVKHIRVYAYFADAILFPDGALWRDA
jgi:hypothetical protein